MTAAPPQPMVLVVAGAELAAQISERLTPSGVQVSRCADLPCAVRTLRRGVCAVVVADLDLPGAGGLPAVHRLVAEAPGTDVVILTASADAELHDRVRRAGALDVLVTAPGVVDRLERVVAMARRRGATAAPVPRAPTGTGPVAEAATVAGVAALAVVIGAHEVPGIVKVVLAALLGVLGLVLLRTRDDARRAQAVADHAGHQVRASQRRHRVLSTLAPVGLFETDADGAVTYVNPRWCELTGLPPHQAWGDGWTAAYDVQDRDRLLTAWMAAAAGGREFQADLPLGDAGRARWVSVATRPVRDASGTVTGHLGTATDITALKATESALREAEELLRGAFEDAPIGMLLTDLDGRVQQANDAFAELVGRAPAELPGSDWVAFLHPQEASADVVAAADLLTGRADLHVREARLRHRSGETIWVALHVTVVRGADGRPLSFLAQVQDVTERRRFEGRLQHMADHDPLTGLLNRRRFEEELDRQVAHVRRYGDRGALLVLDLDHFKLVNDTLGHTIGDEVIVAVADILRRRLRETDVIARLGGDEFAVLLPEADAQEAAAVAEALVAEVRGAAMVVRGVRARRVTASLGIALFEQPLDAGEEVLVNADLAMYDAKEAGRDGWALYASERHSEPPMKARVAWVERIHQALEEDRLVLEAQPIRDLASGEVTQYELLLRMREESGEVIPPAAFLAVAERYDLITDIDRWVASRAIELLHQHPGVTFEINVSGKSLNDPLLLETIETGLQISGVDAGRLVVEVTETAAVANIAQAREFAERLARLGCRFALDDFGSGFGSFYYLKHLPFDYLKIDGEFVQSCLRSQTDQLVIEAVVRIAQGLGKVTVAEFVGDAETERFLHERGVDLAQGFHVGRPMPLDRLTAVGA